MKDESTKEVQSYLTYVAAWAIYLGLFSLWLNEVVARVGQAEAPPALEAHRVPAVSGGFGRAAARLDR